MKRKLLAKFKNDNDNDRNVNKDGASNYFKTASNLSGLFGTTHLW